MRVGFGYDIHALVSKRALILGGVHIPYPKGLLGHSDGDVVFHAIIDAVLGAAALGDIGEYFKDTDPRFKNTNSAYFVAKIKTFLQKSGFTIENLDTTVIAEEPKLSRFKLKIRQNIAKHFGVKVSQVGFKAKTNEGFGEIGQKKAIACLAVASLVKKGRK